MKDTAAAQVRDDASPRDCQVLPLSTEGKPLEPMVLHVGLGAPPGGGPVPVTLFQAGRLLWHFFAPRPSSLLPEDAQNKTKEGSVPRSVCLVLCG